MTLEYQLVSGGRTFDWTEMPKDYNDLPTLEAGDTLTIRERVIPFIPGYYRMTPANSLNHPDARWWDAPPWDSWDVKPEDMQVLGSNGQFRPVVVTDPKIVRLRIAQKRHDHFVSPGMVRCAYDKCWHFLTAYQAGLKKGELLWQLAVEAKRWRPTYPDDPTSTDLYCPATHSAMGVPLTDLDGIPYDN